MVDIIVDMFADILKKLENIERDEDKLKYLEEQVKKVRGKYQKERIKGLIKELKNKIVNNNLILEFTPKKQSFNFEGFEVKYEPAGERERPARNRLDRLDRQDTEKEEKKDETVQYQVQRPVDYYKSPEINSPFLRLIDDIPKEKDRDIRRSVGDRGIERLLNDVKSQYVESDVIKRGNIKYLDIEEYKGTSDIGEDLKRRKKILERGYIIKQNGMV